MLSDTTSVSIPVVSTSKRPASSLGSIPRWEWLALVSILALAAVLDFYRIDQNGFGNTYYAATVQSMSLSWHNWFFAAFDPGGFVSVDKPPLGFWIQVAGVKLFGFHGTSFILPQALAGVLSVGVLYLIVRRSFSERTALMSACMLALSPINVVSNRDNILESLVVLAVLVATLAVTKATERGSFCWLLVAGVCIGLGFNIKMLEAYLVVPAFAIAYLLTAPLPWRVRILHLLAASMLMGLVSLAWIVVVDVTPAASRPYVGSSYHNSEMDLVVAYNGLQRLIGTPWTHVPQSGSLTGPPGPLRLFISQAASQIAWWLPLALTPLVALLSHPWRTIKRALHQRRVTSQQGALLLWGVWLLTVVVFFSQAIFINIYYLTLLSPAIAALAGIGLTTCWSTIHAGRWQRWLAVGSMMGTVAEQGIILSHDQTWNPWVLPVIGLLAGITLCTWPIIARLKQFSRRMTHLLSILSAVGLAGTVGLAPLLWTCSSLHPDVESGLPVSGPLQGDTRPAVIPSADPHLIAYLQQHRAGAAFLVATVDTGAAVPIIFSTGAPVMALGGYTGYDPILTPATLAESVARNKVHAFYLPSNNLTPQQRQQLYPNVTDAVTHYTNHLTQWVAQHCHAVSPDQWSTTNSAIMTHLNTLQLFDCSSLVTS